MMIFTNRHILDGRTPVIPIELSGERNRGLALEARYRWPGIWDAINQALRDGTLAENAGRVLTWNAPDGRTVIIAPACTGSQHPGASRVIQDLAIVTASLKAIGPAVIKADATNREPAADALPPERHQVPDARALGPRSRGGAPQSRLDTPLVACRRVPDGEHQGSVREAGTPD